MSQTFFTYKEGISKFYNCLNNVKGPIKRDYRKIEQIKPVARRGRNLTRILLHALILCNGYFLILSFNSQSNYL